MMRSGSDTSLFELAKEDNQKAVAVELILSGDVDENDTGMTPLHSASCYGNFKVVQTLLLHGADAKRKTSFQQKTALEIAVQYGQSTTAKLLFLYNIIGRRACYLNEEEVILEYDTVKNKYDSKGRKKIRK